MRFISKNELHRCTISTSITSEPVSPPCTLNIFVESLRESLDTEILSGKSVLLNDENVMRMFVFHFHLIQNHLTMEL